MAALPGGAQIWSELLANQAFVAGSISWAFAQVGKIFTYRLTHNKWRIKALLDSGGMPSSHTSLCTAVTATAALVHGFHSTIFVVSLAFCLVVMYDAAGVRRHAGKQAEALNKILRSSIEWEMDLAAIELKEVLGHTPLQVLAGLCVGIITAVLVHMRW